MKNIPPLISLLILQSIIACTPNYVDIGKSFDDTIDAADDDSSPDTENGNDSDNTDSTDTGVIEPDNPNSEATRCCYTVEMFDAGGNGWDNGALLAIIDDEVYSEIHLNGSIGYQEVCPTQGSVLNFFWIPARANQEVMFEIIDPTGVSLHLARNPQEGDVFAIDSSCPAEIAVPDSYEEVLVDDGNSDVLPPESTDWSGTYNGYFLLQNIQTGALICDTAMTMTINESNELYSNEICLTPNGYTLEFVHSGTLEDRNSNTGIGGPIGMPPELGAFIQGEATMLVPSGDAFTTELYGECFADPNSNYMYLYWEMTVQTPNELRYYSGQWFNQ